MVCGECAEPESQGAPRIHAKHTAGTIQAVVTAAPPTDAPTQHQRCCLAGSCHHSLLVSTLWRYDSNKTNIAGLSTKPARLVASYSLYTWRLVALPGRKRNQIRDARVARLLFWQIALGGGEAFKLNTASSKRLPGMLASEYYHANFTYTSYAPGGLHDNGKTTIDSTLLESNFMGEFYNTPTSRKAEGLNLTKRRGLTTTGRVQEMAQIPVQEPGPYRS